MKILNRKRVMSFLLALAMFASLIPGDAFKLIATAVDSVAGSSDTNYGAAIGAVAEWDVTSVFLASNHYNSGGLVQNGVSPSLLPEKLTIVDYAYDDVNARLWYKVDAAPGYTWPEEYYHWVYDYAVKIVSENGMTGVFDADGKAVSELTLPLYDKVTLSAESSLQGSVKYQWQIEYEEGKWVDIYGQNKAQITISIGMLATLLTDDSVNVRCVSTSASKTAVGDSIAVTVDFENVGGEGDGTEEPAEPKLDVKVDGVVKENITLSEDDHHNFEGVLSASSTLTGTLTYKWDIYNSSDWSLMDDDAYWKQNVSNSAEFAVSTKVFASENYTNVYSYRHWFDSTRDATAIRVSVSNGETTLTKIFYVYFSYETTDEGVETVSTFSLARTASANSGIATVAEDVTITVQFINGQTGEPVDRAQDIFNIQAGTNFTAYGSNSDHQLPVVEGYSPYLGDDTTTPLTSDWVLERNNVTANETIVIKYWPAKVNYTVIYYWQNYNNDGYVEHERVTGQQFTGSEPEVENKQYEGFLPLLYENVPCASDGSTVIEVYYDRLYFKMLFDLDGGYGVQPVYARYGTPVTVTNPTKAGYSFMGWNAVDGPYSDSDDETVDITNFTNIPIPALHTNYEAIWKTTQASKVTIIVWGQKADNSDDLTDPDNYDYISKTEDETDLTNLHFNAKPGTSVTYDLTTGGYICGYTEEHEHGTDCEVTCGKTEHTHSAVGGKCYALKYEHDEHTHSESCYACGEVNHNHTTDCYIGVGEQRNPTTGLPSTYSEGYVHDHWWYGELIYIDGSWYEYSGSTSSGSVAPTTCGKTEGNHTHSDACGYNCAGEHTHTDDCYELTCTTDEHTHDASCYVGCTKEEHTHSEDCSLSIPMESDLWEFDHADTVTVAADGTTTLNVYYRRTKFTLTFVYDGDTVATIYEKWGTNIKARFDQIEAETIAKLPSNEALAGWRDSTTTKYTNYVGIMPKMNKTFTANIEGANEDTNTMTYYFEDLGGVYQQGFQIVFTGNGYTVTTDEYYEIEGFVINKDKSTSTNTTCKGAKFYYDREDYNLVFNNYGTVEKNESVLYEAPLSSYSTFVLDASKAPAYYQPGSVTFKGWYAAPQTPGDFNFDKVTPFDFENSKMHAADLILYAWWQPVTHNVRFFYGEEYIEKNQVYTATVDETTITYDYDVPHGSTVQNPYTPPNDPTKGKYIFVGWFYRDDSDNEQMWDFKNTTVTRDTDIYAKWSSNTLMPYEVKFMWKNPTTGEEIKIADSITGQALGGNSKTFDAKGNADLYADYQTGYFPEVTSHTITIDLDDTTKNSYTFWYQKVDKVPYTVEYIDRATGEAVVGTDGVTYSAVPHDDNDKAIVTEKALMIPGYLPEEYMITLTVKPTGENVITFYYNKDETNGIYIVHYWTENLDGTFSEHSTFTGKGVKESTVNAAIKDIENFTYILGYNNTTTGQKEVLSGQIAVGSILELHVFYDRNPYPYKVQYMEYGTTKELAPSKTVTGELWEEIVTEEAISIPNYTLVSDAQLSIQIQRDTENPTVNIITFYYEENKVTINYEVVGPDDAIDNNGTYGTVDPTSEPVKVVTGTANGSTATASSSAYKFVGWYIKDSEGNYIAVTTADGILNGNKFTPTKEADELWIDGTTYYAKFEYNLTSLKIDKVYPENVDYSMDHNQTFLFHIRGLDDNVDLIVTIHGDEQVVIEGLTVGNRYIITELTDWSWRYGNCSPSSGLADSSVDGNSITVKLGADKTLNLVTFTNTRSEDKWLDGDAWCDNLFNEDKN